jgi:hypothetical protein
VELWKKSVVELDELLYEDAQKEVSPNTRNLDFLKEILEHSQRKTALADAVIKRVIPQ